MREGTNKKNSLPRPEDKPSTKGRANLDIEKEEEDEDRKKSLTIGKKSMV
jgi:hypothetical protein